jgi:hypothetical protein
VLAAGGEKGFLKEFRNYWKEFDSVGAFANIGADFELGIAIHAYERVASRQSARLPAWSPSLLHYGRVPDDCLLAQALDFALLIQMISVLEPEQAKEAQNGWTTRSNRSCRTTAISIRC